MFQFVFNFARFQLFGLDFFHACCLPQAKWFLGKLQQNGSVASQHKAREKTHFDLVTDYMYEKSCLGDSVMATHTGKGIWHLCHQYQTSLCDFPQISHIISFPETSVCAGSGESF